MYIKEIELKDFRNYKELHAFFHPKMNIFLGKNAQGKTNLLESIYLNAMARSFKTSRDNDFIRFGKQFCRIYTVSVAYDEEQKTEILVNKAGEKIIKIDGVKALKVSQLLERIYIVIFSPEDLKIVKDEPEKRRRFIDREFCQIKLGYYSDLSSYKKALKQRNMYLKEQEIDPSVLDVWDYELVKYGSRIIQRRDEFIRRIDAISSDIYYRISGKLEKLAIHYEADVPCAEKLEETEQKFYHVLERSRESDIKNRTTIHGPHKDDMKIEVNNVDLRKFGSQGQQRAAAISLKLSEIRLIEVETGEKPILLLDDVLSELDNERQSYLVNFLGENQTFITTVDISGKIICSMPEGKVFKIYNGMVEIKN